MKRGDIILFKNSDWFGKLITWFTGGIYSHSAIYWGKGKILEVSPISMKVMLLSKKKNKDYHVFTMDRKKVEIEEAMKKAHIMVKKAKWYDVPNALFFIILKFFKLYKYRFILCMFENNNKIICSEVTAFYLSELKLKSQVWLVSYPYFKLNSLISPSEIPKIFNIFPLFNRERK